MEPDGDPEARIRDLERPLEDRAQSNELGTQPYEAAPSSDMPPPPYPYNAAPPQQAPYQAGPYQQYGTTPPPLGTPQYGTQQFGTQQSASPYYSAPQQVVRKRRSPALWLLPVILGIVMLGVTGAILYSNLSTVDFGSSHPVSPSISGGGGSIDTPEISIPDIPGVGVPIEPDEQIPTVEAGGSVSLGGVDQKKTIICNQGTVNISGMTNTIEIQGDCASVSVSGMNNVITIESSQTISASGFDNKVTYRGGNPEISQSGSGNVIGQG